MLAAGLLLLTANLASAADLPLKYNPLPPPPLAFAPFTWTGWYVGLNGGYGWGHVDSNGDPASLNPAGGLVGGTVGFNSQIDWFVGGVEADLDWSGMRWSQTQPTGIGLLGGGSGTITATYKNDILSTFAARLGVASGHALFYGKAGGAWTRELIDFSGSDSILGTISGNNTFNRFGWMAGVGLEYAVTNNVTLKAEYNYIDFGSTNDALLVNTSAAGGLASPFNSRLTMNVVKFGANWLFNGR